MTFVKLERYVVNVGQITHIEVYDDGSGMVSFNGDKDIRLEKSATQSLIGMISTPRAPTRK